MKFNIRTLRGAGLVLLGAVLLRILCSCTLSEHWGLFAQPELATYLTQTSKTQTTSPAPQATEATLQTSPTDPDPTAETESFRESAGQSVVNLTEADSNYVQIKYSCSSTPDIPALLNQSLSWDLTTEEPAVLIIHTHGTEAYTPTPGMEYTENGGEYRTTNSDVNMIALGEELTRQLQAAGINAIHDQEYYDYPDYEASYDVCRVALEKHMKEIPSLKLVIDLHRDSAEYSDGSQWATSATVDGQEAAQVMLVIGTDRYYEHPNWEQNLSVALKLHALMEKEHPGSTRPLDLRKQRFNQDLCTGAIIAEIGSAGNTYEQALVGVTVLAEAVIQLTYGAK